MERDLKKIQIALRYDKSHVKLEGTTLPVEIGQGGVRFVRYGDQLITAQSQSKLGRLSMLSRMGKDVLRVYTTQSQWKAFVNGELDES